MEIEKIPKDKGGQTERELELAIACKWLESGFNGILGGSRLASWLKARKDNVERVIGGDDRVYIRMDSRDSNEDLARFVIQECVGDGVEWRQLRGSERWWLYIWWD